VIFTQPFGSRSTVIVSSRREGDPSSDDGIVDNFRPIPQTFEARVGEILTKRPDGESEDDVEGVWGTLKKSLLDVAEEVCGKTRGKQRHRETWWWDDEVAELVKEKRRLFRIYNKSKKEAADTRAILEDKRRYDEAKRAARRGVSKALKAQRRRFGVMVDEENKKGTVFRVAEQMVRNNRDVEGGGCVKTIEVRIVVNDDEVLETWRAYYDKLSNEEFPWDMNLWLWRIPLVGHVKRLPLLK
jgi:hypothetical protein